MWVAYLLAADKYFRLLLIRLDSGTQPLRRFCRKFSLEAFCGMISPHDQPCIMGERNDGDQFQRGPFPTGYHSDGRALVSGVSLELSACRRTDGRAWGPDRPRDDPALGREIQSPVRGGVSSPEVPGVGELEDGRDLYQGQRSMVL